MIRALGTNAKPCTLGVVQLSSTDCIETNKSQISSQLLKLSQLGADLAVLPENALYFKAGDKSKVATRYEELALFLADSARQHGLWLVGGTLPCPFTEKGALVADSKVRSACLLFDPSGDVVARYDKIHLFDAAVKDTHGSYQESKHFEAGTQVVSAKTEFGTLGLMICYDLRFASLAVALRRKEVDFIAAPAAFTYATGSLHWDTLVKARALDSQATVLAAAQAGVSGCMSTWGHACVVSNQGVVLAGLAHEPVGCARGIFNPKAALEHKNALPIHLHEQNLN